MNELRRVLEILQTNTVGDKAEVVYLNGLLRKAGINSNNRGFENLTNAVRSIIKDGAMNYSCIPYESNTDRMLIHLL